MSEPSVDFDWDAIDRDASKITDDERKVIAEQAIRSFVSLMLPPQAIRRTRRHEWVGVRAHVAALVLKTPGYEQLGGVTGIAKTFRVNRRSVNHVKMTLRRRLLGIKG